MIERDGFDANNLFTNKDNQEMKRIRDQWSLLFSPEKQPPQNATYEQLLKLLAAYFDQSGGKPERWKNDRSPRLIENPNAQLSQLEETSWYFTKQRSEQGDKYIDELDKNVSHDSVLSNLCPKTELIICIPVAAAYEMKNIYNTLSLYASQDKESKEKTIVLLNLNWAEDVDKNNVEETMREIERAKKDFPDLAIATFTKEWRREWIDQKQGKIYGTVVKYLNDTALRAIQAAQLERDAFLVTNDADARGMSKAYLKSMLNFCRSHPNADGAVGKLEWGSEIYDEYPGFHVVMRLHQYLEGVYRNYGSGNVASYGGNFMVKAGTFAAVGGYDANMGAGVDTDIGRRIKAARLGDPDSSRKETPILHNNSAWIDTDPSRLLNYYKDGRPIIFSWSDFDKDGYKPRGDLVMKENGEDLNKDFENITKRIEFQLTEMTNWWSFVDKSPLYERAMNFAFPPQNGKVLWKIETIPGKNAEATKLVFSFTDEGRAWLQKKLVEYAAEKKSGVLYRTRGKQAGK